MNTSIKVLKVRMPSITEMVDSTESFLNTHLGNAVKFLDEHPGISMLLSPTSVTRRAAYRNVDKILNREC
jgi:hypothetical protein